MHSHQDILNHFKTADPILYKAAQVYDPHTLFAINSSTNYLERLSRAIVGQQLSTKAAATIWQRFLNLLPNQELTPTTILALEHETMRSAGLSNAKALYVKGIAEAVANKVIDLETLDQLSETEIITKLTQLKGVGIWTVEMFLMFTLGRPDIYSMGDLGLKRAVERLYNLTDPSPQQLTELSLKWSPYRTYACLVLWESLDNKP